MIPLVSNRLEIHSLALVGVGSKHPYIETEFIAIVDVLLPRSERNFGDKFFPLPGKCNCGDKKVQMISKCGLRLVNMKLMIPWLMHVV